MISACAPIRDGVFKKGCLSKDELTSIWNSLPVKTSRVSNNMTRTKLQMKLADKLPDCGDDEKCWVETSKLSTSKLVDYFKPDAPFHWYHEKNAWLSNFDILAILIQYETKHMDFKFLGVFPIDFESLNCSHKLSECRFFDNVKYTQKRFAMVLNLSKHNQRGTHWVAVFFDLDKNSKQHGAFFYDSYASKPPPLVNVFFNNIKKNIGYKIKTSHNTHLHQHQTTECGMFVMNFIIKCLQHPKMTYVQICDMIRTQQSDKRDDKIYNERKSLYHYKKNHT
jgi:hypothetical protein